MNVVFRDPSPDGRTKGQRDWRAIFDSLRERPGEWGVVAEAALPVLAGQIRRGMYGGAEPGEFEAVSRREDNVQGKANIYARYVGEEF